MITNTTATTSVHVAKTPEIYVRLNTDTKGEDYYVVNLGGVVSLFRLEASVALAFACAYGCEIEDCR